MSSSHTDKPLVEVTMPQMGVSVAEGTIVTWRKQPGDWVEADETVCDITTDKIDTEIPSPAGGRLVEILVAENETVTVGTPLARIDTGAAAGPGPRGREQRSAPQTRQSRTASPDRSHVISPVVRRVADEHGIDLSQVTGTGIGGRIRKKDVLAFIEAANEPGRTETGPLPHRVAVPAGAAAGDDRRTATPSGASRSRPCAARSPSTWCAAGAPPRT